VFRALGLVALLIGLGFLAFFVRGSGSARPMGDGAAAAFYGPQRKERPI